MHGNNASSTGNDRRRGYDAGYDCMRNDIAQRRN